MTYWHRARYGWAPKDTWSLDGYLEGVFGGALGHLADHSHGCPGNYSYPGWDHTDANWDVDKAAVEWEADLRKWATAFRESAIGVEIYDRDDGYVRHNAEEERVRLNMKKAWEEMIPWWSALWD